MQKLTVFLAGLLFTFFNIQVAAQAVTTPRPSPAASVAQVVGISTITVKYSRPSVKGREVWGALVPYGWNKQPGGTAYDAPWRAGANENTTIQFSHNCMVEGQAVPAGTYGLFFVVNKDQTGEVVLSKDYRAWGNFFYDPSHDQLRAKIQLRDVPNTEMLTYDFGTLTKSSAELLLNFEKKQFPVKISFAVDDIVMENAEQELKGAIGFGWQSYVSAANYAAQNKINSAQALGWIDHAIALNKSFVTLQVKSALLENMGKADDAKKLMDEALTLATENELNNYGYQLLGTGDNDKAISVFVLNTLKHPESANAFDSMGEAYALKGDKKNALMNFKKSLSLNPAPNVRANSEKYLAQLK